MLRIERAAIRHDGRVYTFSLYGRHGDVIRKMALAGLKSVDMHEQGFTTSDGDFVDRIEALKIANAAGQIKVKTGSPNILFTEDLW